MIEICTGKWQSYVIWSTLHNYIIGISKRQTLTGVHSQGGILFSGGKFTDQERAQLPWLFFQYKLPETVNATRRQRHGEFNFQHSADAFCPKRLTAIHTLLVVAAMEGANQHIKRNLGFSIMPKDTSTCRPQLPALKFFTLNCIT